MHVLVLGSGAREHAMATALARSSRAPRVWVAPGNDGMGDVAQSAPLGFGELEKLVEWAKQEHVDWVIAGSEEPLVRGAWDVFDAHHMAFLGPSAAAARLEGSKVWAKEFMRRHAIPTAAFSVHENFDEACAAARARPLPFVIKVDGLAAGKGVMLIQERHEAERALHSILREGVFGDAGRQVILEDMLQGEELSVFALTDGYNHRILGCAQDHKRAHDGDRGPNTGGMGAYSPVPHLEAVLPEVERRILAPTLVGMLDEGIPYRGFLYLGLMLTAEGPHVLEYNCRLGDPEAQVLLPRIRSDVLDLFSAAQAGDVTSVPFELDREMHTVGVVVASEGYPTSPQTGRPVRGLEAARHLGAEVYCAGVAREREGLVTRGGRVLTVVGKGRSLAEARQRAYAGVEALEIPGSFHRSDIGHRALERAR